jgi:SAM-dependent methyltransferase
MKTPYVIQYEEIMKNHMQLLASQFGQDDVGRTGWTSRSTQFTRFHVMSEIGSLQGKSILDVGCNVGDFYGYLLDIGFDGSYMGIDLVESNCIAAAQKYGKRLFHNKNVFDIAEEGVFDYVIASGIFFLKMDGWKEMVSQTIHKMFDLSKIGIAANFLSSYVTPERDDVYHVDPVDIIAMCNQYTKIFSLRHDYSLKNNDFTLFAYKQIIQTIQN